MTLTMASREVDVRLPENGPIKNSLSLWQDGEEWTRLIEEGKRLLARTPSALLNAAELCNAIQVIG